MMFRKDVDEPLPNARGKVWMPTSPTRNPFSIVRIAISAPMKGLVEMSSRSDTRSLRMSFSPQLTSR